MAAGPFKIYGAAALNILDGTYDLNADTFRAILLGSAHTVDLTNDSVYSDVSAEEVSGTGYVTGDKALGSLSVARAGQVITWDAADLVWTSATITAKYCAILRDADGTGPLAAGDALIAIADLNTDNGTATVSSTAANFTVAMNASGIYQWTHAS